MHGLQCVVELLSQSGVCFANKSNLVASAARMHSVYIKNLQNKAGILTRAACSPYLGCFVRRDAELAKRRPQRPFS